MRSSLGSILCTLILVYELRLCSSVRLSLRRCVGTRCTMKPLFLRPNDRENRAGDDESNGKNNSRRSRLTRDDFDDEEEDSFEIDDEIDRRMRNRFPESGASNNRNGKLRTKTVVKDLNKWEVVNRAVLAGVFVAGIGSGITIDSAINTNPRDLASRDAIGAIRAKPLI